MCFFSVLPDTVHEELKWTSAENLIESQEVQLHYNENHMEIRSFQCTVGSTSLRQLKKYFYFAFFLECRYILYPTNDASLTI